MTTDSRLSSPATIRKALPYSVGHRTDLTPAKIENAAAMKSRQPDAEISEGGEADERLLKKSNGNSRPLTTSPITNTGQRQGGKKNHSLLRRPSQK